MPVFGGTHFPQCAGILPPVVGENIVTVLLNPSALGEHLAVLPEPPESQQFWGKADGL